MNVPARGLIVAVAVLCCLCGQRDTAHAQLPADAGWQTVESAHFRVTYQRGLDHLVRPAVASAERAHAALTMLVADAPDGVIDIVLADNVDYSNGYATPFPSNRIVIYARPPVDVLSLMYVQDWLDLVITHELAHIFNLDVSGSVGRAVRRVFGRVPLTWPVFTALGTPTWSVEGLAVTMESVPGFGRVHGSYHEMVVRTAAIEDEIDSIDRLSSASPVWPGVSRVYIYGSLFFDFLARRYGDDVASRIVRTTAGVIIPAPLWYGNVGRAALGVTFRDAYDDWRRELDSRYQALRAELVAQDLTTSRPLTMHSGHAGYPRFSPDGSMIAYSADDWRSEAQTRVVDVATGSEVWSTRRHDQGTASWLHDGRLLTTWIDYVDRFRVFGDVHIIGPDGADRVTRAARLQNVDISARGRAVAVENGGGTNRLVLLDPTTGETSPITPFDDETHWSLPRFDPAGDRIAVGRWRTGGRYDIVVMDTLANVAALVTASDASSTGTSVVSAAPAWSPDGRWLIFWSDRTGIPNLFAARPNGTSLRQVSNVLTGAFHPDVSPDGQFIALSSYHHDGFRIELMPFDTLQWREPMPQQPPEHAERRPFYAGTDTVTVLDRAAAAAAAADTAAGPPHGYRALRHLRPYYWFPQFTTGGHDETHIGFFTGGRDLVDRHSWNLGVGVAPASGRSEGVVEYSFRGLPTLRPLGLHPVLRAFVARDWDALVEPEAVGEPYIDEREDVAGLTIDLARTRWRAVTGIALTGELARRSRSLHNADSLRLIDPADDLYGLRARAYYANTITPPLAISRENGVSLQLSARHRTDRSPLRTRINGNDVVFDGSYSEFTTWNAAYRALPLPGFARHVIAGRVSGLMRSGPGASLTSIGGLNTSGLPTNSVLGDLGSSTTLLPVRGFASGVRRGNRAWTATGEYRAPLSLINRSLRPLPVFVDRLAGAAFIDAGHAWCDDDAASRAPASSCASRSAADQPIVGAGLEIAAFLSIYGAPIPFRFTAATPLQGPAARADIRFHFTAGTSF